MTTAEKKQQAQALATKGTELANQAEAILGQVVVRNARLSQEVKQIRTELEERIAAQTK